MSTVGGTAAWFYSTIASWVEWRAGVEPNLHVHIAVYSSGISRCFYPEIYSERAGRGSPSRYETRTLFRAKMTIATLNRVFVELLRILHLFFLFVCRKTWQSQGVMAVLFSSVCIHTIHTKLYGILHLAGLKLHHFIVSHDQWVKWEYLMWKVLLIGTNQQNNRLCSAF